MSFNGGIKQLERAVDHSSPSSSEVENGWSYAYTPPSIFIIGADRDS